ncbi:MAG TPA: hypothetical protein VH333_20625 [Pseudonocardiaceae bacterium]|nr:hypothetical protein [Pseudonocardiaceae bacterium]
MRLFWRHTGVVLITEHRGPSDWRGGAVVDRPDWRVVLGAEDRAELRCVCCRPWPVA